MTGKFLAMLRLNPSTTTIFTSGDFITAHLPVFGHDCVCLPSNIETTSLLSIIPKCNCPAQLEIYSPSTDGGKTETSTNNSGGSSKTEELPGNNHISLFNVRMQKADSSRELITNMSKKLRISNNDVND